MAMTKKEREEFAALETKLRITAALRWTEAVPFDLAVPAYGESTSGFAYNIHNLDVQPAWSSPHIHGIGYATEAEHRETRGSASQRGIPLHSTKLLALRAMRHSVEMSYAKNLAMIDRMIEKELAE